MNNRNIPLALLDPSPTNPRKTFNPDYITSLAENFITHTIPSSDPDKVKHGVKQSLLVRPRGGDRYEIVCGECRYRGASKALALPSCTPEIYDILGWLPCRVEELSDREVLEIQLVENVKRTDLTGIEEARGYQRLLELQDESGQPSYTAEKIAQQIGKSVDAVYLKLKLLKAPEKLLAALDDKELGISERHCVLVARHPDAKQREELAQILIDGDEDWLEGGVKVRVPLTLTALKALIRKDYMVSLKGAPWKLTDGELVAERGPCDGCQYLAKNFLQGTDELAQAAGRKGGSGGVEPLTCCNPACHRDKMQAYFKREAEALKTDGGKVLSKKEVEKVFYPHGGLQHSAPYVILDDKPGYEYTGTHDDSKVPTYAKMLEKVDAKPVITIAQTPRGEVVKMIDRDAAKELAKSLRAKGELKGAKPKPSASELKQKAATAKANKIAERQKVLALSMLSEFILTRGIGIEEQMGHINLALFHAGMDGCRLVAAWLQCEPEKVKGTSLNQGHYQKAILAHLGERQHALPALQAIESVIRVAKEVKVWGWAPECYKILAAAHGFDFKKVEVAAKKAVEDELAEKEAKKAAKNGPEPKKAPMRSKSAAAARNASGLAADERTRDRLSKGKLTDEHVTTDTKVEDFAKRLLEDEVLPSEPNEVGVFTESVLFQLRCGRAFVGVRLSQSEDGRWATGYEYKNSAAKQSTGGGGLPKVGALLKDRFAAVDSELLSLVEHLDGDDYETMIERLKDARGEMAKLDAMASQPADEKVSSIEQFAKEMGMEPVESIEEMAAKIASGKATYADVLGKTPHRDAEDRKAYDARRVKLNRAVKKLQAARE